MQPGDVPRTAADVVDLVKEVGYRPSTEVEEGIKKFVEWFVEFYALLATSNT
jgi:UDP-glucuronate 4-epimerase